MNTSAGMPDPLSLAIEPARPKLPLSQRINAMLTALRTGRPNYPACFVVQQGAHSVAQHYLLPASITCGGYLAEAVFEVHYVQVPTDNLSLFLFLYREHDKAGRFNPTCLTYYFVVPSIFKISGRSATAQETQ